MIRRFIAATAAGFAGSILATAFVNYLRSVQFAAEWNAMTEGIMEATEKARQETGVSVVVPGSAINDNDLGKSATLLRNGNIIRDGRIAKHPACNNFNPFTIENESGHSHIRPFDSIRFNEKR